MENTISINGKHLTFFNKLDTIDDILKVICQLTNLQNEEFYLTQNGKKLCEKNIIFYGNIQVNLRLNGGKGGFGSMLRAIGAQIEKTTNREACRDLSGRRLRDINEEKRLKAWLDKKKDREAEAEEKKRKKLEKLMAVPKHEFKDLDYESARTELTEKVSEAVEEGFKKAKHNAVPVALGKRKATTSGLANSKKANLWIDEGLSSSTDTDDSSDTEDTQKSSNSNDSGDQSLVSVDKTSNDESRTA